MEAQELLVINPLLYSNYDKYIWIDDSLEECRNAQCLFDLLLRRNIYIKGFASKSSSLIGLKMYNKIIVNIDLLEESQIVFYDTDFRLYKANTRPERVKKARIVNTNIIKKDIIIWGSGITGEKACQILAENGICVKCFIDSDKEKQDTYKCDLPVYAPKYLENHENNKKEVIIIEALEQWKRLDDMIAENKWERYHFSFGPLLPDITYEADGVEKNLFKLSSFWMFHRFVNKRVYIYGNGTAEKEFAKYLRLMDYDFAGFLISEDEENKDDTLKYIEEILYEENFYIWIYEKDKVKKLQELGLQCLIEWEFNGIPWDITINRRGGLDVSLGYTTWADSKYPGIVVYGEEKENDYKIAILGSSTSEGLRYPFKSWPELLFDGLKENRITVYNGGVSGYTSGQELIKMIRDILPLKPDMIIVYDGANDLNTDTRYPFAFPYAMQIYDFAKGHLAGNLMDDKMKIVSKGTRSAADRFEEYLNNIRNMHAVAEENNIKFFSFCHPVLSCKKGKTIAEKNILLSMPADQIDFWVTRYFRENFELEKDIPDYFYDFTGIFDNTDDVFIDVCHVNEKGNRIIANRVKAVIYDTILQDIDKRNRGRKE